MYCCWRIQLTDQECALLCSAPVRSSLLCSALLCSAQHVENTFHCAKYTLQFHFSYSNRKNHPPTAKAKTLAIHVQNVFVLAALRFGLHATSVRERVLNKYYIHTNILYVVCTVFVFSLLRSQLSHAHLYVHINKSTNTHAHSYKHKLATIRAFYNTFCTQFENRVDR